MALYPGHFFAQFSCNNGLGHRAARRQLFLVAGPPSPGGMVHLHDGHVWEPDRLSGESILSVLNEADAFVTESTRLFLWEALLAFSYLGWLLFLWLCHPEPSAQDSGSSPIPNVQSG